MREHRGTIAARRSRPSGSPGPVCHHHKILTKSSQFYVRRRAAYARAMFVPVAVCQGAPTLNTGSGDAGSA